MLGVSQELRENLCIAAHLAHVSYAGRIDDRGKIVPVTDHDGERSG